MKTSVGRTFRHCDGSSHVYAWIAVSYTHRAKEVRIVGDEIEPKVYTIFQALKMAEETELNLVEISPNAQTPVCRIIDYSKFLYPLKKRQKEQKAKQVKVNVKDCLLYTSQDVLRWR